MRPSTGWTLNSQLRTVRVDGEWSGSRVSLPPSTLPDPSTGGPGTSPVFPGPHPHPTGMVLLDHTAFKGSTGACRPPNTRRCKTSVTVDRLLLKTRGPSRMGATTRRTWGSTFALLSRQGHTTGSPAFDPNSQEQAISVSESSGADGRDAPRLECDGRIFRRGLTSPLPRSYKHRRDPCHPTDGDGQTTDPTLIIDCN